MYYRFCVMRGLFCLLMVLVLQACANGKEILPDVVSYSSLEDVRHSQENKDKESKAEEIAVSKNKDVIDIDDIVLTENGLYSTDDITGSPAEFSCSSLSMRMAADSSVASLKLISEGRELLRLGQDSPGFYMTGKSDRRLRFENLYKLRENTYMVTSKTETQKIIFTVSSGDGYLVFRIKELIGIPTTADYDIYFNLSGDENLRVVPLDYMTFTSGSKEKSLCNRGLPVIWRAPWIRGEDYKGEKIPSGAFALYYDGGDDAEDEIITHIWANEGIPHPKVDFEWDEAGVNRWMKKWLEEFSDRSVFWYSHPKDRSELDRLLPYIRKMGMKELHIYHWTWLSGKHHCDVRKGNFFPNGREDLVKLSEELKKDDICLSLHYNFCEIPFDDPIFIGTKPRRDIASWGTGTLAKPIDESQTTIYFRPDPGVDLPNREGHDQLPPALTTSDHFNFVRIDDEIVRFKEALNTNGNVWVLSGCDRGLGSTLTASHSGGSQVIGLIGKFGILFSPDTYSALFDEMVIEHTSLWNDAQLRNCEYDGSNPAHWEGAQGTQYRRWLGQDFSQMDHPVLFTTGSHYQPWGFFERWFNRSTEGQPQRLGFRGDIGVRPRTTSLSNHAATIDEAHARMSQVAACGNMTYSMQITLHYPSDWEQYGRWEELVDVVADWKAIGKKLTAEQRKRIFDTLELPLDRGYCTKTVWWLRKEDGVTKIYPQKNPLTRREGDVRWGNAGSEVGWLTPQQYIKVGESLELENPYKSQAAMFTLRLMSKTDYQSEDNIDLFSDFEAIKNPTEMKVEKDGKGMVLSYENHMNRVFDGREGSLMASWNKSIDMRNHRGIGFWVTGDGSNAMLIIRTKAGRDYPVKLDFKGKRYIEIPDAQYYWNQADWGGPTKSAAAAFDYNVSSFKIGFGRVPANTKVRVKVEGVKALKEYEATLVDPKISLDGRGSLTVKGEFKSTQWLEYRGGRTAVLYDQNWNKIADLPVVLDNYVVGSGWHKFTVSSKNEPESVWISTRFITEGEPIVVK